MKWKTLKELDFTEGSVQLVDGMSVDLNPTQPPLIGHRL